MVYLILKVHFLLEILVEVNESPDSDMLWLNCSFSLENSEKIAAVKHYET